MNNTANTTTEQGAQSGTTQPEVNGTQTERTFTQDEVNKIVSERLSREREKTEAALTEANGIKTRETEITKRENALQCKEYIQEQKLPRELLDIFSTDNAEEFKGHIELLRPFLKSSDTNDRPGTTGAATPNNSPCTNSMRRVFGLK